MNGNGEKVVQSADIDVVALSEMEKKAVIGECKFKNEKIDKGIYETLIRRANVISPTYDIVTYLLFSLSGYTKWFDSLQDKKVILVSLKEMYQ